MVSSPVTAPTLDGYQLRLSIFEGPLDVLLRLIEREQLSISEVSLLAVLDQFIAFTRSLESPAPDVIAEFAAVAGRLSLLKSRALLPHPPKLDNDPDEPDLVRQLEEYRTVKAAAELLAGRQRSGSGVFGRGEAIGSPAPEPPRFVTQPSIALAKAVRRWFTRLPARPVVLSSRRIVTLREMISRIFVALGADRHVTFASIRATCEDRHDLAAAFLAMLMLLRRQAITANQDVLFGEIVMTRIEPVPEGRADAGIG